VRQRVYIETTIPSYYYDARPKIAPRCEWTQIWWDNHRANFDLVTSPVVMAELESGNHPRKTEKLDLLKQVQRLAPVNEVLEIAEVYIREFVMPRAPIADAMHLAFASFYRCDVLLTWNCAHLANAMKYEHIKTVNLGLALHVPLITTPLQLMGVDLDEN
jgi:hypothetical protein